MSFISTVPTSRHCRCRHFLRHGEHQPMTRNCLTTMSSSSTRSATWTRAKTRPRWVRTVERLIPSAAAICLSRLPSKIKLTIRACRGESFRASAIACHSRGVNTGPGANAAEFLAGVRWRPMRAPIKERRTKDAPRTPAKGHTERALADAPCGARAQGTGSVSKTWRFSWNQRLDARASIQLSPGRFFAPARGQ